MYTCMPAKLLNDFRSGKFLAENTFLRNSARFNALAAHTVSSFDSFSAQFDFQSRESH